jgi:hypothetical protein
LFDCQGGIGLGQLNVHLNALLLFGLDVFEDVCETADRVHPFAQTLGSQIHFKNLAGDKQRVRSDFHYKYVLFCLILALV